MPTCFTRRRAAAFATVLALTGCSAGDGPRGATGDSVSPGAPATAAPSTTAPEDADLAVALHCDPLDEQSCLLPWPNDAFTVPDPRTDTGRRLAIQPTSTPRNAAGVNIAVDDVNRGDGFSPGSTILAFVPGIDAEHSRLPPSTDIGASLAPEAPIVLLDTTTGERLAHWAELDAQAPHPDQALLMIHPAALLGEGHHVVVAIRGVRDAAGQPIPPSTAFQAALDGTPEPLERAKTLRTMLAELDAAGVGAGDLFVAWEFTVASTRSLTERMATLVAGGYAQAAAEDAATPSFTVAGYSDAGGVRTVDGTFEVANFLTGDATPGTTFELGADGLPLRNRTNPTFTAAFRCLLPLDAPGAVATIVYAHGLLGSREEVGVMGDAARRGLAASCATDQIGMSSGDILGLASVLGDLSRFPQIADRLQQGFLNTLMLGRLVNDAASGFASSPAFAGADAAPLIVPGRTHFVGVSQGGVLGAAIGTWSTEWERAVLAVPGTTFSLLLPRSSNWPAFQAVFEAAYPDPTERVVALQIVQLLWDRGESSGYAQHLTADPYPGVEAKRVLVVEAFGDHQVANVATEVLARTIGAEVHEPALREGRSVDADPLWGIPAFDGDARAVLVVWDFGTPAPPVANTPPNGVEHGADPHAKPVGDAAAMDLALSFLLDGDLGEICGGEACGPGA